MGLKFYKRAPDLRDAREFTYGAAMPVYWIRWSILVAALAAPSAAAALEFPAPKVGLRIEFAIRDSYGRQIATNRIEVLESAPGRIVWHVRRGESGPPSRRNIYANTLLPIENDTGAAKARWSYPGDVQQRWAQLSDRIAVSIPYRIVVEARRAGGQPQTYKSTGEFKLRVRSREQLAVAGRTYDIVVVSFETVPAGGATDRVPAGQEHYWLAPSLGWYLRREDETRGVTLEAVRIEP
jgi:hypothetical protein